MGRVINGDNQGLLVTELLNLGLGHNSSKLSCKLGAMYQMPICMLHELTVTSCSLHTSSLFCMVIK